MKYLESFSVVTLALVALIVWAAVGYICLTINHAEGAAYHQDMLNTFGPTKINTP